MFDKLKQLWQYIKENNVGPELKERFFVLANKIRNSMTPQQTDGKYNKALSIAKTWFNPLVRPANETPVSDGRGVQAELDRKYKQDPSQFHDNSQQARDMGRRINERKDELDELARPRSGWTYTNPHPWYSTDWWNKREKDLKDTMEYLRKSLHQF